MKRTLAVAALVALLPALPLKDFEWPLALRCDSGRWVPDDVDSVSR